MIRTSESEGLSATAIILGFFGVLLCALITFCLISQCCGQASKGPRTDEAQLSTRSRQNTDRPLRGSAAYNSEAAPRPAARDPSPVVDPEAKAGEEPYEMPVAAPQMQKSNRRRLRNLGSQQSPPPRVSIATENDTPRVSLQPVKLAAPKPVVSQFNHDEFADFDEISEPERAPPVQNYQPSRSIVGSEHKKSVADQFI